MLKDCLDVFGEIYAEKGEALILDTYVPAEGAYILVDEKGELSKVTELPRLRESPEDFDDFLEKDCLTALIDINKAIDKKKIIQSNNYHGFWVKKESLKPDKDGKTKLTIALIDAYFDTLKAPQDKYKAKRKSSILYEAIEAEIGKPEEGVVEKNRDWVKAHIFSIMDEANIESDKGYLKIFFDVPEAIYQRENSRYIIPNIYNTTDYNVEVEGRIFGLPNDNMGLNSKKPYLENKSRKNAMPYLISTDEVALQKKFFDYLYNQANMGKNNIYLSKEKGILALENNEMLEKTFRGYYLRIQKGKEVEIHDFDEITGYEPEIDPIVLTQAIPVPEINGTDLVYEKINTLKAAKTLISNVYFKKFLSTNFFTEAKDIKMTDTKVKEELLRCRNGYFNWFFKGDISAVKTFFAESSFELIKNSIGNNYIPKAIEQFNVRESVLRYLEGDKAMEQKNQKIFEQLSDMINEDCTGKIEEDALYYFAAGQIAKYLLSFNRGSKPHHSLINPILNAKNVTMLKEILQKMFVKYNYALEPRKRFDHLYAAFLVYEPEGKKVDTHLVTAGYLYSSLIYEKKEKTEGETKA